MGFICRLHKTIKNDDIFTISTKQSKTVQSNCVHKIIETHIYQSKSMDINGNHWKSMEISEIQWKSMKSMFIDLH